MFFRVIAAVAALLLAPAAWADARVITVSFSDATLTLEENGVQKLFTQVVLPKKSTYYPVPSRGVVVRATDAPTWTPTDNMHRDYPGRWKAFYGPGEAGNAMGACKLYIDFVGQPWMSENVRIHGNGQPHHLGRRLSRSCVRVLDSLCAALVALSVPGTEVHFVR